MICPDGGHGLRQARAVPGKGNSSLINELQRESARALHWPCNRSGAALSDQGSNLVQALLLGVACRDLVVTPPSPATWRAPDCVAGLVVRHEQLIAEDLPEDRPRAALGECVIGAVDDVYVAAIAEPLEPLIRPES